jgi:hypothetical protein
MPLVSNLDDNVSFRPANPRLNRKLHNKPVQLNAGTVDNVFGNADSDVPFSTPLTTGGLPSTPSLRSFTLRPMNNAENRPMNYVPLKCDQEGSRPEGASLFDAPYPEAINKFPIKPLGAREVVASQFNPDTALNVNFVNPLQYELGIRPSVRVLKTPLASHFLNSPLA